MAPNCENCKTKKCEDNAFVFQEKISLYTHESDMARMSKAHEDNMARMSKVIDGLWIIILVLIVLLVGTNLAWIAYESQFETVSETVAQDVWQETSGGDNSFIGGDSYGYTENPYSEDYYDQTP